MSNQINDGRTTGYSEKEITARVLKAMTPNLRLRNVLKTMTELTLARIMRFLQAHFEEGLMWKTYANVPALSGKYLSVCYSLLVNETEGHYCF